MSSKSVRRLITADLLSLVRRGSIHSHKCLPPPLKQSGKELAPRAIGLSLPQFSGMPRSPYYYLLFLLCSSLQPCPQPISLPFVVGVGFVVVVRSVVCVGDGPVDVGVGSVVVGSVVGVEVVSEVCVLLVFCLRRYEKSHHYCRHKCSYGNHQNDASHVFSPPLHNHS